MLYVCERVIFNKKFEQWAPWGPFGGPFSNLGYFKQFWGLFEGLFEDINQNNIKKR